MVLDFWSILGISFTIATALWMLFWIVQGNAFMFVWNMILAFAGAALTAHLLGWI